VQRDDKMTLRRVEAANKERANVRSTRHQDVASLLTFVAADGSVLLSVYILKGRFGAGDEAAVNFTMERAPSITRGTWPRYYSWIDTGFLDAGIFKEVLAKVAEVFHARYPGIQALLFGDQLAAHRRSDIVEYALGLGLFLFSLSKNTSHITQPLDEAPFGTMQADKVRRNEKAVMDGMLTNTNTRDALLLAAYAAERRAFTGPIIRGAFRRRGLWPFDPELMKANVRANLGLVDIGETAVEAARHAASEVIMAAQGRVDEARAGSSSGRAVVKRGVVHSPFLLLEQQRKVQEAAAKAEKDKAVRRVAREERKVNQERELAEKVASRELHRCRVCADKVHRGGKTWVGCACGAFWVCPACSKQLAAGEALAEHVTMCAGPPESGSGSQSGVGDSCSSSDDSE